MYDFYLIIFEMNHCESTKIIMKNCIKEIFLAPKFNLSEKEDIRYGNENSINCPNETANMR